MGQQVNTNRCPVCSLEGKTALPVSDPENVGMHRCPECSAMLIRKTRPGIFGATPYFINPAGGTFTVHNQED